MAPEVCTQTSNDADEVTRRGELLVPSGFHVRRTEDADLEEAALFQPIHAVSRFRSQANTANLIMHPASQPSPS